MDCRLFEEMLQAHLDGYLQELPERAVSHARACSRCQKLRGDLEQLRLLVAQAPGPALSDAGQAWLLQRIESRTTRPWQRQSGLLNGAGELFGRLRWQILVPSGVALALLFYVLLFRFPGGPPEPPAAQGQIEFQELLNEHAAVAENPIFSPAAPVVTTVALAGSQR